MENVQGQKKRGSKVKHWLSVSRVGLGVEGLVLRPQSTVFHLRPPAHPAARRDAKLSWLWSETSSAVCLIQCCRWEWGNKFMFGQPDSPRLARLEGIWGVPARSAAAPSILPHLGNSAHSQVPQLGTTSFFNCIPLQIHHLKDYDSLWQVTLPNKIMFCIFHIFVLDLMLFQRKLALSLRLWNLAPLTIEVWENKFAG